MLSPSPPPRNPPVKRRQAFTDEDDDRLMRFLAQVSPWKTKQPNKLGRSGNIIYRDVLTADLAKYPWANRHPWQAWRDRYQKRAEWFDDRISEWQRRHGIDSDKLLADYGKHGVTPVTSGEVQLKLGDARGKQRYEARTTHHLAHGVKRKRSEDSDSIGDYAPDSLHPRKRKEKEKSTYVSSESKGDDSKTLEPAANHNSFFLTRTIIPIDCQPVINNSPHGDGNRLQVITDIPRHAQDSRTPPPPQLQIEAHADIFDSNDCHLPLTYNDDSLRPSASPLAHNTLSPRLGVGEPRVHDIRKAQPLEPVSVTRSHHPTPPSTHILSETSVQSPSADSSLITSSAEAKEKCQTTSSMSPVEPSTDAPVPHTSSTPVSRTLDGVSPARQPLLNPSSPFSSSAHNHSPSPPSQGVQEMHEDIIGRESHSVPKVFQAKASSERDDEDDEPSSDGPFATSPSSPRRAQVIRGIPKPCSGKTFRDNVWVRDRKVVPGKNAQKAAVQQMHNDEESNAEDNSGNDRDGDKDRRQKAGPTKLANSHKKPITLTGTVSGDDSPTKKFVSTTAIAQQSKHTVASPSLPNPSHSRIDSNVKDALRHNNTPISPLVSKITQDTSNRLHVNDGHLPRASVPDVFESHTPIASSSNHDPYVLRTDHLPPSSVSAASRVRIGSPLHHRVSRDPTRRRTFHGLRSYSSLPSIDLAEKLTKRSSTRSPALSWTRAPSNEIQTSAPIEHISRPLLTAPERRLAHRRPPRASVIPITTDSATQHIVPISYDELSSSTLNLIVKTGLTAIFKRMEENHGFSADVVRRAWFQQKMDLNATDKLLLRMRIAAENASRSDTDEYEHYDLPASKPTERVQNETGTLDVEVALAKQSAVSHDTNDYTPPARSRAGHYRRLSEEGRLAEARQHEISLTGGGSKRRPTVKNQTSSNKPTVLGPIAVPKPVTPPRPAIPPVWSDQDDQVLRIGDQAKLQELVDKFDEDTVRRRFLAVMRQNSS
ncbi:hypothetical protein K439DRAFT_1612547 [Ramaria rubella]|nr:hypothetical protein K439DRAFT_1612547 [Ramaria rubella]